jgi:hypothetical protein
MPATRRATSREIGGGLFGFFVGDLGIGFVFALSYVLGHRLHVVQPWPFVVAFALVGGGLFALILYIENPLPLKVGSFSIAHVCAATVLICLAFKYAGTMIGLLVLSASSATFHLTWFCAAFVVAYRIGSTRAAVIATTLEGAFGFAIFLFTRMLHLT